MDEEQEYEPSEYLRANSNFFKDYCFKFEGLSVECEKGFTHIVKDLGGTISKNAKYTLVEKSYFEKTENKKRKDLYHLNFILDSLNFKRILDIELYRCDKTVNNENEEKSPPLIKNKRHTNLVKKPIFQNESSNGSSDKSDNDIRNNSSQEYNSDNEVPISPKIKQSKSQTIKKRIGNISLKTTLKNISKDRKLSISSETSSSGESVKVKTEPESSEDESYKSKRHKKVNVKREVNSSSNDNTNSDSDYNPLVTKRIKKETDFKKTNSKITNRNWVDTKDFKNNSNNTKNDKVKKSSVVVNELKLNVQNRSDLKHIFEVDENDLCTLKKCTFEPEPHNSHSYAGRNISDEEKKVIMKYLIKNNVIKRAKGIKTWEDMIADGYLTHRSSESLRNCLRRGILPKIHEFKLPDDILDKFLLLEEKKSKGKKIW